jgi:multidrug efflux pump subunit AcrA (membrane-fusion protein)
MAAMDAVFATEFGLPLDYLAGKYDQQALNRAAQAQQALDRAAQAEAQVQQALDRAAQAQAQARQASDRAEQAEAFSREAETLARQALDRAAQAEARASQAEIIAQGVTTQLSAVYSSTSWVVTKPLRACKRLAVGDFSIFGRLTATSVIKAKQALRSVVSTSSPPLHQRLGGTAMNTTIPANDRHVLSEVSASMSDGWRSGVSLTLRSPLSRRIYMDLKAAIENEKLGED